MRSILCFSLLLLVSAPVCLSRAVEAGQPQFSVTITAAQPSVRIGAPVVIHITLTSSRQKIGVPELRHDGTQGEYNYRVTVTGSKGSALTDTEHGRRLKNGGEVMTLRSTIIKYLNYGDQLSEDLYLNNLVNITIPGDYLVQVERADEAYIGAHIKSNKLLIHITP